MSWLCSGPMSKCRYRACPALAPKNSLGEASGLRSRNQPLESQAYGFLQRQLDVGCACVRISCSFNHNVLFVSSSHALTPLLDGQNRAFPVGEVEGLPVCLNSWLQNVDICALS